MKTLIFFVLLYSAFAFSQEAVPLKTETEIDGYVIRHVLFNSTFVLPEVAKQYKLKRSNYESLLNISVNKKGVHGGLPVKLQGTAKNLMQQLKTLEFKEISEKDTVYYLAPVRVSGEELMHFDITVQVNGQSLPLKFSQKVYSD